MDQYKRILIIVCCVICVSGAGVWFFLFNQKKDTALMMTDERIIPPFLEPRFIDENNKIYLNRLLHFSLVFPKTLELKEYSVGNTSTIVFENKDTGEGFQVFVVPYNKEYIDNERFKMDVPSGVMIDPKDVLVDGHTATMFFSHNSLLGETREVWFVKDGFLYEITARKDLDEWLGQIISNWKFI